VLVIVVSPLGASVGLSSALAVAAAAEVAIASMCFSLAIVKHVDSGLGLGPVSVKMIVSEPSRVPTLSAVLR